ncbi:MAG: flagellar hook-associated protein FlgK, partial [Desulfuromusa sp.]|nr:flagellar hook-associated protein FlgK [Desulfuromusa sp.]
MGGGLNAALNAGRTSLQTNQKAIEITGLNIANVNTEGYSRQTANLTPYPSLNFGDFFIGTGVQVGSVGRSHDVFLDGQIKDKSAEAGLENSMVNTLAELERVVGIGDGSLSSEFDQFFDSWRQLSTNPGGEVERQMVLQRGELIGNTFTNIYNETQQVVKNINNTITSKIDGVNLRLDEIAQLNNRISAIEMSGQEANSDRDRRDMLLKSISESIGARSFETSTGTVSVQLANGMPLVEGNEATHIVGVMTGTEINLELDFGTTNIPLDRTALGGEFRGLYDVRDVTIPDVVSRLDQLA